MAKSCRNSCSRGLWGCLIYVFVLVLILFLVIFVILPFIFKYSTEIQRTIIFPTWATPSDNFSDIKSFGLKGVRNFYVTVDENENITLGLWQILPDDLLSEFIDNDSYDYERLLANDKYDIVIYLHGNGGVRSVPLELYEILRRYFHVIACDYRGYGDSTRALLTEDNIVNDTVHLFKWVRERTKARIFFWGHSLGTGVSTHTVANLNKENETVSGLILETPFSAVVDVMEKHFMIKIFSWLPWAKTTLLDPMIYNGFGFNSTKYIVDIDCPIMILHAKDDSIIPYEFATKLYETAMNRNLTAQGSVTYHLFEAKGYDHMWIYLAPELPSFISNFIAECLRFEKRNKSFQ